MERPNFLNPEVKINDIEQLQDEPSYFQKVKELAGKGKFIKRIKKFSAPQDAKEYLAKRPQKENGLQEFLPNTHYIIGASEDSGCAVYTIVEKIDGVRLDSLDLSRQKQQFYEQFDNFLFGSLKIYEDSSRCPGINLKNFILNEEGKLYYVDSEPYPEYGIEPFEMAYARKQTLTRIFSENYQRLLPKTADWIDKHTVANYKKAKSEAQKKRKRNNQIL